MLVMHCNLAQTVNKNTTKEAHVFAENCLYANE